MRKGYRLIGAVLALALVAAGCGDDDEGTAGGEAQESIGEGEGAVSILAWPYYAEDGTQTPGLDWVTSFENATGCIASVKYFGTSDEAYTLFATGDYDVVSASGDSSMRSVANGDVAPINTSLIDHYADLAPFMKEQSNNSIDGTVYGVPHGWGANVLQYNTEVVKPAPDSWGAVFDANSPYKGKIAAYDGPIYIADAAVYLMATQPDLEIENPYALDDTQFQAAVDLLKAQKPILAEYWSDYAAYEDNFRARSSVLGTAWQIITNTLKADTPPTPVESVLPKEGSTAWADNWMVHSDAARPNCAYMWINHITSPAIQATQTSTYGEAPANLKACATVADHCAQYHAADEGYYSQLHYWTTPTKECLDGRTDVDCKDYSAWVSAWAEIKG